MDISIQNQKYRNNYILLAARLKVPSHIQIYLKWSLWHMLFLVCCHILNIH